MKSVLLLLALGACAQQPVLRPVEVDVPAACPAAPVAKPDFTAPDPRGDLFVKTRALLKELDLRKGYEAALEAALRVCAG